VRPRASLLSVRVAASIALLAAAAALAAACGSGGTATGAPAAKQPAGAVVLRSTDTATLGKILTDGNGRTLYLFKKDTGPQSNCTGACATDWPPVTATSAPTASGVSAAAIKTVRRGDGKMQVVFNGHPLYYYSGDGAGGTVNGEGQKAFGAAWYALSPAGQEVKGAATGGMYGGY
jgi:predicted lipoprotein with Yx(FWY)xxD motif